MTNHVNPKMARHILAEHGITGSLFLNMGVEIQMGIIADVLSKKRVGPFTREEFLKGAGVMEKMENAQRKLHRDAP